MVAVRRKTIFDPIHGPIPLQGAALELVQHAAFQRLWSIRQTGFAHLVFPGANHTRLEHSLGVYGLIRQIADGLGLETYDVEMLASAGLLHDLGHGPFSHTLEPSMHEVLGFGHERISRRWITGQELPFEGPTAARGGSRSFESILRRHGLVPSEVAELVEPGGRPSRVRPLAPLLHGPIDADRIDYLQRDAHYTGVAHGMIEGDRLRETMRIRRDRLLFAEKGRNAVEGFLVGRALMYSAVYYHKTVRAAEVMAQSAVERLPGYPEAARPLFALRDGELLDVLRAAGDRPRALAEGLLDRRLFKRAWGLRNVTARARRRWTRLAQRPGERRALEDRLSAAVGGAPGDVLLDLAGVSHRAPASDDWAGVTVLEDGRAVHPFRAPGSWRMLALRPPTLWAVSAYVRPGLLRTARSRLARAAASALG